MELVRDVAGRACRPQLPPPCAGRRVIRPLGSSSPIPRRQRPLPATPPSSSSSSSSVEVHSASVPLEGASGTASPAPLYTAPAVDWRRLGRHRLYGNGEPRSLMRGWPHVLALAVLELLLLACAQRVFGLQPLSERAHALARWTTVGFYGSVIFHLVPWAREDSYNFALGLDFLAITLGLTGQVCAWVGVFSWPAVLSISLTLSKAVLVICGYLQKQQPLWQFQRLTRRNIVLCQFFLSSFVEALVIPNKLMVAAIWTSKWLAFAWFIAFARADARGSGLIFKGWWHDHDWFHLLAICTAGLQLAAAATYA